MFPDSNGPVIASKSIFSHWMMIIGIGMKKLKTGYRIELKKETTMTAFGIIFR